MSNLKEVKQSVKKDKSTIRNEITSLKKSLKDYQTEREANWKIFKSEVKKEIKALKKLQINK